MAAIVRTLRPAKPLTPDTYERLLSGAAVLLLFTVIAAIGRGSAEWHLIPVKIWTHLATIGVALILTPVILLRPRGSRLHRRLGWIWCGAMMLTALISFTIHRSSASPFSIIHILSAWVLIQVPLIVRAARTHDVAPIEPGCAR